MTFKLKLTKKHTLYFLIYKYIIISHPALITFTPPLRSAELKRPNSRAEREEAEEKVQKEES